MNANVEKSKTVHFGSVENGCDVAMLCLSLENQTLHMFKSINTWEYYLMNLWIITVVQVT